mgnify:CR=1 FL=1
MYITFVLLFQQYDQAINYFVANGQPIPASNLPAVDSRFRRQFPGLVEAMTGIDEEKADEMAKELLQLQDHTHEQIMKALSSKFEWFSPKKKFKQRLTVFVLELIFSNARQVMTSHGHKAAVLY